MDKLNPDDAEVILEDEAAVEVELDTPTDPSVEASAPEPDGQPAEVEVEQPKKRERVRLRDVQSAASAAEEAAAALTKTLNEERELRKAAEATALAERQRAEAAARELQETQAARQAALEQVASRELSIVTSGISAAQQQIETLQDQLTRYYEAGEFAEAAKTQVNIAKATSSLAQLEESKLRLENRIQNPARPATEGRVAPAPVTQAERFEAFVSQYAPAAQQWLRAHPECVPPEAGGDAAAYQRMIAGHHMAIAEGIPQGSAEYFKRVEAVLAPTAAAVPAPPFTAPAAPARAAAPPPRAAQPSAPPSREPPTAPGVPRNTRQVMLSKEQQEAAILSFPKMDKKEAFALYAKNLIALETEGKLGRTTH